jgi:DNA polymerase-3 subunit alpha
MGKKIPAVMAAEKEKLFKGLLKNGMSEKKAEELWALIEPFAAYGFGKAHAASYGKVAYQTAYMKANFPAIYMSAVLTAESGDTDMISEIIGECKRMQIPVLPPDINESFEGFTVVKGDNDSIRFGLTTIKNFGEGIGTSIINERKAGGKFTSLSDFLRRIKDKNLNKKSLESLIKAGAMDSFGERATLLHNLDRLLTFNKEERASASDQDSLFSALPIQAKASEVELEKAPGKVNQADKLLWEKELLGLYISGHPLDNYKDKLEGRETNIKKIKETAKEKSPVVFGGIIEEIRSVLTKKGEKMIFLKLSDLSDSIEAVAFPKILEEFQDVLVPENCVVVKGTFSLRNGEKSILIDKIKLME